jgi:hypothetical protein
MSHKTSNSTSTHEQSEKSTAEAAAVKPLDKPQYFIAIVSKTNFYETKQIYTIPREESQLFMVDSKRNGQWPSLSLKGRNKRGNVTAIKQQLEFMLHNTISGMITDDMLKEHRLVVARDDIIKKGEMWTGNAFSSVTASPGIFTLIINDPDQSHACLSKQFNADSRFRPGTA